MQIGNGQVLHGDNLILMKELIQNGVKVDLIYIDPPYGIDVDKKFGMPSWKDVYEPKNRVDEIINIELLCSKGECNYLRWLYPRLVLLKELLSERGSIYVHLDWHVGHYVKLMLDDIFGKENFVNEIIWSYGKMASSSKKFMSNHDNILFYKKNDAFYFNPVKLPLKEPIKRLAREMVDGKLKNARNEDGSLKYVYVIEKIIDDNWGDIPRVMPSSTEYIGYATQKPEKIIERMIDSSCPHNGIVLDVFGGSGTTAAVAERLGRRWIVIDNNPDAIETIKARIKKITINPYSYGNI